jgi:hypothetical protein
LLAQYQDQDWRRRFYDLVDLVDVLRDCIIADGYTAPESVVAAITLVFVFRVFWPTWNRRLTTKPPPRRGPCLLSQPVCARRDSNPQPSDP